MAKNESAMTEGAVDLSKGPSSFQRYPIVEAANFLDTPGCSVRIKEGIQDGEAKRPRMSYSVDPQASTSMIQECQEHEEDSKLGIVEETCESSRVTKRGDKLRPAPLDVQVWYFGKEDPDKIPVRPYEPYFECVFGYTRYHYGEYFDKVQSHGSGFALKYTNDKRKGSLKKTCSGVVICESKICDFRVRPETTASLRRHKVSCPKCRNGFLAQIPCCGKNGKPVTQTFLTRDGETVYLKNEGVHSHERPPQAYPCLKKGKVLMAPSVDRARSKASRKREAPECSEVMYVSEPRERKLEDAAPVHSQTSNKKTRYEDEEVDLLTGKVDVNQIHAAFASTKVSPTFDKEVDSSKGPIHESVCNPSHLNEGKSEAFIPTPVEDLVSSDDETNEDVQTSTSSCVGICTQTTNNYSFEDSATNISPDADQTTLFASSFQTSQTFQMTPDRNEGNSPCLYQTSFLPEDIDIDIEDNQDSGTFPSDKDTIPACDPSTNEHVTMDIEETSGMLILPTVDNLPELLNVVEMMAAFEAA